jgi:uncharacterized repeat protein (TIGR03803 family)
MRSAFRSFGIRIPELAMVLVVLCAISTAATTDRILHDFSAQERGNFPYGLLSDSGGNLFGTTLSGGDYNCGAVFELAPKAGKGWSETVLHSFGFGEDGCGPWLILMDAQGNIYGTTVSGGTQDNGTAFRMSQNSNGSWTETVLYDFQSGDGNPTGALVMDAAGNLYGATSNYGQSQYSVFELTPSGGGWTRTILYTFPAGTTSNVSIPGLALDSSGDVYGTLTNAVSATQGLVFELTQSAGGWTETTLFTFAGGGSGGVPTGSLLLADGDLFGTTLNGGTGACPGEIPGCGVVFKLVPGSSGWTEEVLYSFPEKVGADSQINPSLSFFDSAGNLYGLAEGGSATFGLVFQLTPDGNGAWEETDLFDFEAGIDGAYPQAIVLGNAGQIYGTNWGGIFPVLGKIFELKSGSAPSGRWGASTIYSFPTTDGQSPTGGLVADAAGNFYGTTVYGGANNVGSVFKVSPAGKESMIYSFGPGSTSSYDSRGPSPLIADGQGNFYGTTEFAGAYQWGSVFELSTTSGGWQYTDLYSFGNEEEPIGGVVFDKHGNIYGVTYQNGAHDFGTVFELTKNSSGIWQETAIYNFEGYPSDGANPVGGLTIDAAGNLYGTTEHGGAGTCTVGPKTLGCGTAFELSFSGTVWIETVLHSFLGVAGVDGASPMTNLILDKSGNLYGTTLTGGSRNGVDCPGYGEGAGCGTVFELSASASGWNETILYEFLGRADGVFPSGPLLWDQSGNLYGVVEELARHDGGAVFKLSSGADGSWTESLIYSFGASKSDGMYPVGGLIFGASGNLYGVTFDGGIVGGPGHSGQGTVFEVKP